VWQVRAQLHLDPQALDETPGLILGLYAHPADRPDAWGKVARLLVLAEEADPRVERAEAELRDLAGRQRAANP
jgi:hypothetical protein